MKLDWNKRVVAVGLACACVGWCVPALVGCGGTAGAGTLSSEVIAETGAFKAHAENADVDASVGLADAVVMESGDVLMVSPDLTQGKVEVTLIDDAGGVAFDREVDGRVLDTYEVEPGTYDVEVKVTEAGTTGDVVICPNNEEEFNATTESLEDTLEQNGVTIED